MVRDCRQFESRLQELLDDRIDPETDVVLIAHAKVCVECHQSLMTYSILHTNFLNDSDSMKIKLENLGIELSFERSDFCKARNKKLTWLFLSTAAMVLIGMGILYHRLPEADTNQMAQNRVVIPEPIELEVQSISPQEKQPKMPAQINLASFAPLVKTLNESEVYQYSSELPGLKKFKTLSYCFDWIQDSIFESKPDQENENEADSPDLGFRKPTFNRSWLAMSV